MKINTNYACDELPINQCAKWIIDIFIYDCENCVKWWKYQNVLSLWQGYQSITNVDARAQRRDKKRPIYRFVNFLVSTFLMIS